MKSSLLKSLILVGLTGFGAIGVQAQPAPKIAVVDLAKLFDGYWQTAAESNKINSERAQAQLTANGLIQDRTEIITKAQQLFNEATNNPAITIEAKTVAEGKLKTWSADITDKNNQLQKLSNDITSQLQQEFATYKGVAIAAITDVATRVAKTKGANLLIDKSNSTTYQTSAFLYIAPDYSDITEEVLKELNKDHPMTAAPAAAPAAAEPAKK